jgi:hypothetical protein
MCGATSTEAVRDILRRLEDLGCDEAILNLTALNRLEFQI